MICKRMIAPIQAYLLSQGRCVGCGKSLVKGNHDSMGEEEQEKVTCSCGRIFIHHKEKDNYRRALFKEV